MGSKKAGHPPHMLKNRNQCATRCRDWVYGNEDRPFSQADRAHWARILGWFVGRGMLTYEQVEGVAQRLGTHMPALITQQELDQPDVRIMFREALYREVKLLREAEGGGLTAAELDFKRNLQYGRRLQWAREALYQGLCPLCGKELPCHGYTGTTRDEQGRIRATYKYS